MKQSQILLFLVLSLIFLAACNNSGGATLEGSYAAQRTTAGLYGGPAMLSVEKYTFFPNGTVELRIGGPNGPPNQTGKYQPAGSNQWTIYWDSGQAPAEVVREGDNLRIGALLVSPTSR